MRILIDSYSECFQNEAGGVQLKIKYYYQYMSRINDVKLFDKWTDKIADYDILHIFKPGIQHGSLVRFAISHGVPIVVSATAETESRRKVFLKKMIDRMLPLRTPYRIMKEIYRSANAITVQTVYEKEYVCGAFGVPAGKVFVVPNGISIHPTEDWNGMFRKKYGIEDRFVLQVGRFDRNKNQLSTIRAVAGTDMKLVLIGGPDKDDLDYYKQCKREAGDNVIFTGWIDHEDPMLVAAYQDCQAMILPSHKEIFGNVLHEAAACGANIVATQVLPLKAWGIQDMCWAIDPDSVRDIREKLLDAYTTPKTDVLKEKTLRTFTWESVSEAYNAVYKRILGG